VKIVLLAESKDLVLTYCFYCSVIVFFFSGCSGMQIDELEFCESAMSQNADTCINCIVKSVVESVRLVSSSSSQHYSTRMLRSRGRAKVKHKKAAASNTRSNQE